MSLCRLVEKSYLGYSKNTKFDRDKTNALSSLKNQKHCFVLQYFKNSIEMFTNGKDFYISGKKKKCRLIRSLKSRQTFKNGVHIIYNSCLADPLSLPLLILNNIKHV